MKNKLDKYIINNLDYIDLTNFFCKMITKVINTDEKLDSGDTIIV